MDAHRATRPSSTPSTATSTTLIDENYNDENFDPY